MNKDEFTRQVLAAEGSLYRVARSILSNDEDCADAIQNAILKAYQKKDMLKNENLFKTWLTRIVINECYQLVRYAKRYTLLEETMVQTDMTCMQEEGYVMQELMRLDEKYRLPIILQEIEGYSVREIGKILGLSETNVRNRVFRGKSILRKRLSKV